MAGLSTGLKKKLTLTACEVDSTGNISENSSESFAVMLNPAEFSHEYSTSYNQKNAFGQTGSDSKFSAINPDKISFNLVIDGTGVVNLPNSPIGSPEVDKQIQQLEDIVYQYDGNNHEPKHVKLLWGSLIFYGRLTSMTVEYTLFEPSGKPLRAKVKLAFTGFMSKEERALRANKSSPDLTHYIEFKAGDTLPLLCQRVYRESAYYLTIAKINDITHFRDIKPGQKLFFPPLE